MIERYANLDGLRAISCLCIIAMHIRANADYNLGSIGEQVVSSWTHFVPLFLMISGFGMFCGYFERFKGGNIDLNSFYTKRYKKILPFFITLILIDIIVYRSLSHIIEGITEATLVFGLLPNNRLDVIGVSWTIGVIFLFYMIFPFIIFLCWTRRRAWLTFIISILISLFCSFYFFTGRFVIESFAARHNFLYCAPWILGGAVVYNHRNDIKIFVQQNKWIWFAFCIAITIGWFFLPNSNIGFLMVKNLLLFMPWFMYIISVDNKILNNKVMKYLSEISLELYLAQMVVFRVVEKVHCLYLIGHGWSSFLLVWFAVVVGLIVFIEVWKRLWTFAQLKME